MATNTFGGGGVPMELSVSDAIYALSDIIEAYQSPSHVGLLETFRKEHGGNMIKRMQIVYPAAIKLQAQVNSKKMSTEYIYQSEITPNNTLIN